MKVLYIFDFDGTLADTLPLAFMCFRETFLKFNGELLNNAEIEQHFGGSEQAIIEKVVKGSQEQKQQAVEFFYQLYQTNHSLYAQCPDKIRTMLAKLKQQDKKIAVFTGKGRRSLDYSLSALGLTDCFDLTISDDDIAHSKPAPDGLLKILAHFALEPTQAIYFGDSDADLISGQGAGVETHKIEWISNPDSPVVLKE
ncbi:MULTISPECIES: HAD family hydrolase [Glaesserella]|uniref:phosphoglycolate phosphatase n=1 Tax=Glaesserella australis TaxID=2094024 RepID=A0A328BZJ6_9PAST|nr:MULTISPECIES: HAD family hydrolase [Glaesserella]AUI65518.1 HAD family hydrolase [Glaesserella sp. 15-184]RAL19716.1 HAD family hydrolase [Glaesserella australis]